MSEYLLVIPAGLILLALLDYLAVRRITRRRPAGKEATKSGGQRGIYP